MWYRCLYQKPKYHSWILSCVILPHRSVNVYWGFFFFNTPLNCDLFGSCLMPCRKWLGVSAQFLLIQIIRCIKEFFIKLKFFPYQHGLLLTKVLSRKYYVFKYRRTCHWITWSCDKSLIWTCNLSVLFLHFIVILDWYL